MQKTVRAPGLRKPLLLHGIHDIYGWLCIIGNTISILRQMHGDLMAVAAPSLEAKRKRKKKKKESATKTPLWKKISSRVVVVLFFFFLFFIFFLLFFLLFHIVYVRRSCSRGEQPQNHPTNPTLRPDLREVMEERSGHRCLELLLTVFVTRIYGQPCEMIATGNVGASGLAGIVEFTGYRSCLGMT